MLSELVPQPWGEMGAPPWTSGSVALPASNLPMLVTGLYVLAVRRRGEHASHLPRLLQFRPSKHNSRVRIRGVLSSKARTSVQLKWLLPIVLSIIHTNMHARCELMGCWAPG